MPSVGKIARRTFLIGSAAIAGGVAFGAYLVNRPIPNPLLNDLGKGEAAITPFVKITSDGVTLITPRADKGQGSYSIQAYLIAEELDIDPNETTRTPGLPDQAYYNSEVATEGSPLPAYDESAAAETIRSVLRVVPKLFSVQITGGSSTVPDMYEKYDKRLWYPAAGSVHAHLLHMVETGRARVVDEPSDPKLTATYELL